MKTLSAFERALVNSVLAEYGDIPAEELIQTELSDDFILKSQKLIKNSGTRSWYYISNTAKRLLIAAIVMLLLIGSAMAISSIRKELIGFFIKDDGLAYYFTFDMDEYSGAPKILEEIYLPTYIPDGYVLSYYSIFETQKTQLYTDANENLIMIQQTIIKDSPEKSGLRVDMEHSSKEMIDIDGQKILCVNHDNGNHSWIWTDGEYFIHIYVYYPLDNDDLMLIYRGLEKNSVR